MKRTSVGRVARRMEEVVVKRWRRRPRKGWRDEVRMAEERRGREWQEGVGGDKGAAVE